MNSPLKTKLPGRTSENLALACSLVLHAGFIILFSAWQWEWRTAPKSPPKVVKIKFLPLPTAQKDVQKPASVKTTHFSPAQPVAVTSHSIPALNTRTPRASAPVHRPVSWTKQAMPSQKRHFKTRRAQPTAIPATGAKPLAARPLKRTHHSHDAAQEIKVRPSPLHKTHQTPSVQAAAPVEFRSTGQLQVVQRRSPTRQATFQNFSVAVSQASSSIEASNSVVKNIQQRPVPVIASTEAGLTALQAVEPLSSLKESRPLFAALPRELTEIPSADRVDPDINMDGLRGLFTDQVRQRVANAKTYPRIAKRRGMEGQPVIAFTLNRLGRLTKTDLAQSSGYKLLDQAAMEAVHEAAPYPEIPAELKTETYKFKLPVSFVLK